jgi:hypothetical protein
MTKFLRFIGDGIILMTLFSEKNIKIIFQISHLLIYIYSSVNPIIYNTMSGIILIIRNLSD